jgi:hypothetical protein
MTEWYFEPNWREWRWGVKRSAFHSLATIGVFEERYFGPLVRLRVL